MVAANIKRMAQMHNDLRIFVDNGSYPIEIVIPLLIGLFLKIDKLGSNPHA